MSKKRKYYRTNEFIKLQNQWYDKLKSSGFVDLEWLDRKSGAGHSTPFLKTSLYKFSRLQPEQVASRLEYFRAASDFLNSYDFEDETERFVFAEYCEGTAYRTMIAKAKDKNLDHVPTLWYIFKHLKKLKREFMLWQLDQPDELITTDRFMENNDSIF